VADIAGAWQSAGTGGAVGALPLPGSVGAEGALPGEAGALSGRASGDTSIASSQFVRSCFSRVRRMRGSLLPAPACCSFSACLCCPAVLSCREGCSSPFLCCSPRSSPTVPRAVPLRTDGLTGRWTYTAKGCLGRRALSRERRAIWGERLEAKPRAAPHGR